MPDAYVAPVAVGKRMGKKAFGSALAESLGTLADRGHEILSQLDTLASACIICYQVGAEIRGYICGGEGWEVPRKKSSIGLRSELATGHGAVGTDGMGRRSVLIFDHHPFACLTP